jgi:hypothetical protein
MEREELHQKLEELHQTLGETEAGNAGEREVLEKLRSDVGAVLSEKETLHPRRYESLAARLREGIEELEASHPNAALLMGRVVDALANLGI